VSSVAVMNRETGFTLIELVVVLVMIATLAAIALPRFLTAGSEANAAALTSLKGSIDTAVSLQRSEYLIKVKGGITTDQMTAFRPTTTGCSLATGRTLVPP